MNPYSTELRRAMTLADQILALKQNRGLADADAMQVDAGAFFPTISRWTQLCGFRMSGPPEAGKALLQKAAARWLRAAHQSGAASAFVFRTDHGSAAAFYGSSIDNAALFQSLLPECETRPQASWFSGGYRCSGLFLGTFAADGVAEALASSGLGRCYAACIALPAADADIQALLEDDRRLARQLEPCKAFPRVCGSASRRTVEVPVQNVAAALDTVQEEITLLEKARSTGLVQAVIRFGADSRADYLQLAGIIRACLAGREELPGFEPIRCFDLQGDFRYPETCLAIPRAAVRLPDGTAAAVYAASLQSAEAAASFCVPPTCACPGFYVQNPVEDEGCRELFPVVRPITAAGVTAGRVLGSGAPAVIPFSALLCHTAVFGACCTGKTTLVKNLLVDLWARQQTPFVVLEAAKKEYNALLGQIPSLMVYTSGADGPLLRINPLRPEDGTLIENHAAAVTLALTASTGAEHPIPEAFSGLLQQTYHRFGWEYGMAAYTDPAKPFPTFADVLAGVEDYVAHHARYGPEVRQNLTGALELRAETMTSGALGRVFADPFGMTAKQLLTVPTVLELADFSEEATAFLMNILMFRFQSYLQRLPESSALQRLIVLEEAHNVFRKTDTEDSALARSNLAFDKMFAEIRASGTGLVLSDQRPSLMPDSVMANTAVKLCLGMDSSEDRSCMGGVVDLSVLQRRALHAFQPGECLLTVRGTPGVFHVQAAKAAAPQSTTAACLVCGSRFRCRKSAVQSLLAPLDAGQMQYHLARIRADPYNIPVLAENIEQMLQQLRITAAAPTKLCLLGEMLARAGVPLGESRQIVTAYHNHLKGGTA